MSEPFDLDAAVSATPKPPFRFTWGGQAFELPSVLDLPIDHQLDLVAAAETIDAKNDPEPAALLNILRMVIGEELLARLSAAKPMSALGIMALLNAWMQFQGEELGKSSASRGSSASTARPSKSTSRSARARRTN